MRYAVVSFGVVVMCMASGVAAQTKGARTQDEMRAAYQAHKGDFDYLLGDWEFTADSKEYGKFRGYWSAVRFGEGQIMDEYRIVDDKGATIYATTTLRNYNSAADRWELVGLNSGNGLQDAGTGHRVGNEVQIEQRFGVTTSEPSTWKIRYFNIGPDHFSWAADRSTDGGKTWVANHQTIEAHRIGPPRALGQLSGPPQSIASANSSADPITGEWGMDGNTLLELKFDGKGTVTGRAFWRGSGQTQIAPIARGTFDPKTGALRLDGEATKPDTGSTVKFVIEGTVAGGTLSGTYRFDTSTGDFNMTRK